MFQTSDIINILFLIMGYGFLGRIGLGFAALFLLIIHAIIIIKKL